MNIHSKGLAFTQYPPPQLLWDLESNLFNLDADYIMRNAGLKEAQAGIKIAGTNISNLRYADDTTLKAKSEEEVKSLLMKLKEWKTWLKTQHSKN